MNELAYVFKDCWMVAVEYCPRQPGRQSHTPRGAQWRASFHVRGTGEAPSGCGLLRVRHGTFPFFPSFSAPAHCGAFCEAALISWVCCLPPVALQRDSEATSRPSVENSMTDGPCLPQAPGGRGGWYTCHVNTIPRPADEIGSIKLPYVITRSSHELRCRNKLLSVCHQDVLYRTFQS